MSNEMFTQLPSVTSALPSDIICAVQAGVSVQETLAQVIALGIQSTILTYSGNPNGFVAGTKYQLLWDSTDNILFVATFTGTTSTTIWTPTIGQLLNGQILIGSTGLSPVAATLTAGPGVSISNGAGTITISGTGSGIGWTEVTATSQAMVADNGYVANNSGLVTFTLPTIAAFGTDITIIGKGSGGWSIAQNAGQIINVGDIASTTGVGGSVASTNQYDSIDLICTTANTVWTTSGGPQGNITIV